MAQIPDTLSESTKKKLAKMTPEDVSSIVLAAINDVDNGSEKPMDELVKNRLPRLR